MSAESAIRYYPDTDTMAIEIRPWPGGRGPTAKAVGGEDAGDD